MFLSTNQSTVSVEICDVERAFVVNFLRRAHFRIRQLVVTSRARDVCERVGRGPQRSLQPQRVHLQGEEALVHQGMVLLLQLLTLVGAVGRQRTALGLHAQPHGHQLRHLRVILSGGC